MKILLITALWITVAIASVLVDQPMVAGVLALLATIEIYTQHKLCQNEPRRPSGESLVTQALATAGTGPGDRADDWKALV